MKIQRDGNMWCVTKDDFINLQESEALFITDEEYKSFIASINKGKKTTTIEDQYQIRYSRRILGILMEETEIIKATSANEAWSKLFNKSNSIGNDYQLIDIKKI